MRDQRRQLAPAQNFTASQPIAYDLPRDNCYREIVLRMEFQVSVPGAMTPASAQFDCAPWTNLKRIELTADGKDTIKSYDGITLLDINQFDYHAYPYTGDLTPAAGANSGTLNLILVIGLESPGMQEPQKTWLDSRKLSSLELKITWGAGLSDIYGTVGNAAIDTMRITPYGHEILDVDPAKSNFAVNQEVMSSFAFPTNTATQFRYRLNVGNSYRSILINTRDSNNRAAVDRLQTIRLLQQGAFYRRVWDAGALKSWLTARHHMGIGLGVADAPTANPAVQTTGRNGGYRLGTYLVPIAEDGSLSALLDTYGFSDLSLELDWDGANTTDIARITSRLLIPTIR